jgi:hypothetical protein
MMKKDDVGEKMTDDNHERLVELQNWYAKQLYNVTQLFSEHQMFWELTKIETALVTRRTMAAKESLWVVSAEIEKLIIHIKDLQKALEVGFKICLDNINKKLEEWNKHENNEKNKKREEGWNDYTMLDTDEQVAGHYEDYEPNPYDGTYSEE